MFEAMVATKLKELMPVDSACRKLIMVRMESTPMLIADVRMRDRSAFERDVKG